MTEPYAVAAGGAVFPGGPVPARRRAAPPDARPAPRRATAHRAAGSVLDVLGEPRLNHRPEVAGGLLAAESADLPRGFFASRR